MIDKNVTRIKGNKHDLLVKSGDIEDDEKYHVKDNELHNYWILTRRKVNDQVNKQYIPQELFRSYNSNDYLMLFREDTKSKKGGGFQAYDNVFIIHDPSYTEEKPKKTRKTTTVK